MRYGITTFATDKSMDVAELAREAEDRGLDSLYIPEHSHIPASRETPAPSGDDELAEEYRRAVDPFVTLAAAAATTERISLGTGICLVAQHDPIIIAKTVATLQNLSQGRFVFGIGFGWNVEEMRNHGVDYSTRRARVREHILAMKTLWEDDEASFEGEFVRFDRVWAWPKPDVPVPVLVGGGAGPKLFSHVAEYADGWIPIGGSGLTRAIPELRSLLEDAGRDPAALRVVPFGSSPDPGKLEHFERIGVTECVFPLPSAGRDVVLPILDTQADLLE
ncbi:MAG: LLM class F420-dependent oxidoreductase [Actinobacteria bacterium]|nr:MAG: LLM class F420-dependent oxidoreductase [Actinomycetota bacterium]RIK08190.1 MAG: LLM class F420-dependent oxidoreductase [Acidobacteriota bacterium]